jgi:hypothetical protein
VSDYVGSIRHHKRRRSVIRGYELRGGVPDIHITDCDRIKKEVPDFDPDLADIYSQRALQLVAEKILLMDPKSPTEDPMWLNGEMYIRRAKREIFVADGIPDPAIVSGLYWRTHPQGRKVNSDEARKEHRAAFYR